MYVQVVLYGRTGTGSAAHIFNGHKNQDENQAFQLVESDVYVDEG